MIKWKNKQIADKIFFYSYDVGISDHQLTKKRSDISTVFKSPYGKLMYSEECPKRIRYLEKDEQVKYLSDGQLLIDDGSQMKIYQVSISLTFYEKHFSYTIYNHCFSVLLVFVCIFCWKEWSAKAACKCWWNWLQVTMLSTFSQAAFFIQNLWA